MTHAQDTLILIGLLSLAVMTFVYTSWRSNMEERRRRRLVQRNLRRMGGWRA